MESVNIDFSASYKVKHFIATEKIKVWKDINKKEKVLLMFYNENNHKLYFEKLDEIVSIGNIDNPNRCGFYISEDNTIEELCK